jgi:hypothetical protein
MNSNPFIRPQANQARATMPAPQRPGSERDAGLAEALAEANGPARRRAAARRDAKTSAACQAWLFERERAQPTAPAAWTQAVVGSCPVDRDGLLLGPRRAVPGHVALFARSVARTFKRRFHLGNRHSVLDGVHHFLGHCCHWLPT